MKQEGKVNQNHLYRYIDDVSAPLLPVENPSKSSFSPLVETVTIQDDENNGPEPEMVTLSNDDDDKDDEEDIDQQVDQLYLDPNSWHQPLLALVKKDTKLFLCSGVSKPQGCVKFALIQYNNEAKQTGQRIVHSLSRNFTNAEKKYSSLELEALALAFGMENRNIAFFSGRGKQLPLQLSLTKNFYVKVVHYGLYHLLSRKKYKGDNVELHRLCLGFIPFEKIMYVRE